MYEVVTLASGNYGVVDSDTGERIAWRDRCGNRHEWTAEYDEAVAVAQRESAIAQYASQRRIIAD
jgi:hypothetical protein